MDLGPNKVLITDVIIDKRTSHSMPNVTSISWCREFQKNWILLLILKKNRALTFQ
jgi:hypothetical protein